MTCSTARLRKSECSAIHTQPTHAHTPPHVARRTRARTAHAPRTHRARRLATRIAKLKIWRHKSLRSLELAAEEPIWPPAGACLAAVLSQFDYQANEVQRENLEVKVQGGVTAAAPGFVMPALEFVCRPLEC